MKQESSIKVWDPFVRIFHWGLVIAFVTTYVSEEEILGIHTLAGIVWDVITILNVVKSTL